MIDEDKDLEYDVQGFGELDDEAFLKIIETEKLSAGWFNLRDSSLGTRPAAVLSQAFQSLGNLGILSKDSSLDLDGNVFSTDLLVQMLRSLPPLQGLSLNRCRLGAKSIKDLERIFRALPPTLKYLSIGDNLFIVDHLQAFAAIPPSVCQLGIDSNDFSEGDVTRGLSFFVNRPGSVPLQELDLSDTKLGEGKTAQQIGDLFELLRTVIELNLADNCLQEVKGLHRAFEGRLTSLESLNLENNYLPLELSPCLSRGLRSLDLSGALLGIEHTAEELVQFFRGLPQGLTSLYLRDCGLIQQPSDNTPQYVEEARNLWEPSGSKKVKTTKELIQIFDAIATFHESTGLHWETVDLRKNLPVTLNGEGKRYWLLPTRDVVHSILSIPGLMIDSCWNVVAMRIEEHMLEAIPQFSTDRQVPELVLNYLFNSGFFSSKPEERAPLWVVPYVGL